MSKKYHESHPTISFRCLSIDEYNTIKKMVGISRKSESDFVREVVLGAVEKESQSYTNGWYRGINHIAWFCPVCGELKAFPITDIFEEQSLVNLLAQSFEKTAYHPECLQKKKRQEEMRR